MYNWPLCADSFTVWDKIKLSKFLFTNRIWTQGDTVRSYEEKWEKMLDCYAIMVSSGSSANELIALRRKWELQQVEEWPRRNKVVFAVNSWISNCSTFINLSFEPIFCDVNKLNLNVTSNELKKILDKDVDHNIGTVFYTTLLGFGVVAEAMGGLRHLTAEPGRVPVRVGISIGDTLASLHGVIGILLALQERHQSGKGQVIDVALYEAVFNCMESLLPEYSAFGEIRQAAGSALPGIAPTNAYLCADGGYVLVAGNGDSIFKRLMKLIGRDDLGADPELENNDGRVKRVVELDQAIGQWANRLSTDEALEALDSAAVPAGRIYTVADIAKDPHYKARGNIETIQMANGSKVDVPGVFPKLSRTPGSIKTLAPDIGQNTDEILRSIGLNDTQVASLKERGIAFTK